jgi:ribose 5-phosphate isomerase B
MKITIGSDHRGYELKKRLVALLGKLGHEVLDLGTTSAESCDYPDQAFLVAAEVGAGRSDRGILLCGTGLGMCIAANKVLNVRAVTCHDRITAEMSRRHNDANVLCLSAHLLGDELVEHVVRLWLETPFEAGRHARRVEKISRYEQRR